MKIKQLGKMIRQILEATRLYFKFLIRASRSDDSWLVAVLNKVIVFASGIEGRSWHAASLLKVLGEKVGRLNKGSFSVALATCQNSRNHHYHVIIKHNQQHVASD